MKKLKVLNAVLTIIWLIMLAVEGIFLLNVHRLNMIPEKYFLLLAGVFIVVWLLAGFLLLCGRKGKLGGNFLRLIAFILAVVMVGGCLYGSDVVAKLYDTLHQVNNPTDPNEISMAVFVLHGNPAESIQDAENFIFGSLAGYGESEVEAAVGKIENELGREIINVPFPLLSEMMQSFYNGEIDALLLESHYAEILIDMEEYSDFGEKTRILYEVMVPQSDSPHIEPNPSQTIPTLPTEATEPHMPQGITDKPFIIYVSGSDSRDSSIKMRSRSDVNILVIVHPVTKQVLLVNTPRDYFIPNPAGNWTNDKLTHCGNRGVENSIEALESYYGLDVNYYVKINFTGVERLVDAMGGITVYSDSAFMALDTYPIVVGENKLDGAAALAFSRDRYQGGGDNGRGRHQMQVIKSIINKMTSSTTLITNYASILDSLDGMFVTDMTPEEMGELVKMQIEDMAEWNIQTYAVTGRNGSAICYSIPGVYLSVMYPNEEAVEKAKDLVGQVISGKVLTEEDLQ